MNGRLLAIGLDGFEISVAERLMAEGRMPHLTRLRARSARFLLNHGPARSSGLAWEHVSTGRTPEALERFSAVSFDAETYDVRQEPTHEVPVFAQWDSRTVLFDVPYCDLTRGVQLQGLAQWGAHDPGAPRSCNPPSLTDEITERFGPYPASDSIYAMVWHSVDQTAQAGAALAEAVRVRARAAEWVLNERLPDWEFAMVVVSEPHSALEPMWHGMDPRHPLHGLPSAPVARQWLETVYEETDRLIGRLCDAFPEAAMAVFAMHGMGENGADVPTMVLLPELLYRRSFGRPWMREPRWKHTLPDGTPLLAEHQTWHQTMAERVPQLWSDEVKQVLARAARKEPPITEAEIDWQPAARYRPFWPDMEAFAMPSFYDGRVRVNLKGRERFGTVPLERRREVLDDIRMLLQECVDPVTAQPVVAEFLESARAPFEIGPTESDLYIHWAGMATGFVHPQLGLIGPVPHRRPGGHSGPFGFLYCVHPLLGSGDRGEVSSFDVMPTLAAILGEHVSAAHMSGQSLLPRHRHGA